MSNKEVLRYRKLISKKLDSMGIKDEITYRESARKPGFVMNQTTGQLEQRLLPRQTAQNLHRHLVRVLSAQGEPAIKTFLAMDPEKLVNATKQSEVPAWIPGEAQDGTS